MEGPKRAPSSPPETPVPMKRMPLRCEILGTAIRIGEQRVAAVDDDVAGFKKGEYVVDHLIDSVAGLDHEHDAAWTLEQANEFLNRMRAGHLRALCLVVQKVVHFRNGAVEDSNLEAVIVHVEH